MHQRTKTFNKLLSKALFKVIGQLLIFFGITTFTNEPRLIMSEIALRSTIACPVCGHKKEETMPTDACQYFYQCVNCKTILKPLAGDCCVFCSYGTVKCPPVQMGNTCC
jgi:hypothetical protein